MRIRLLTLVATLALVLSACNVNLVDIPSIQDTGTIVVQYSPADAQVFIDPIIKVNRVVRAQQESKFSFRYLVDPGEYALQVWAPGYETYVERFTIEPGELRFFEVTLAPASPPEN